MENIKAQKLLNRIQQDLMRNGIIMNTMVGDLKDLRAMVIEEKIPLLAKVLRLTYEHIERHDDFEIAIPEDEEPALDEDVEDIEDVKEKETDEEVLNEESEENGSNEETEKITGQESLEYLLSLVADHTNKLNELELREYVSDLKEDAGEDY